MFIPLDGIDPDAWDDSALIKSFEQATQSHKLKGQTYTKAAKPNNSTKQDQIPANIEGVQHQFKEPRKSNSDIYPGSASPSIIPKPPTRAGKPDSLKRKLPNNASHKAHQVPTQNPIRIPPPPPALYGAEMNPELESLLISWYEAGYRAGQYVASNPSAQ